MINLMQGDCLEKMKEIPSGSVDMILADPPYELSKSKGGGMMGKGGRKFMEEIKTDGMIDGINTLMFLDACLSLFDKKQKFCGVFTCSTKQVIEYITWAELNKLQYGIGVWNKTNPAPLCNCKYLNDVEYWIYIKGNKSKILGDYHSKSMVYTSQINKKDKKEFGHPTCKPVELMEKFIFNHTLEGATVLDPFMGSGSTGVAAKNLNRKFIGIELDEEYFKIAQERIENV
jgi:DNA modification methylase